MKPRQLGLGRKLDRLNDLQIAVKVSKIEREEPYDLRSLLQALQPEACLCVFRKAIQHQLHQLE